MRTSVLAQDPKARRNHRLALIAEVCIFPRFGYCGMPMQYETRDLPFLLFLQEDGTIFAAHQGVVDKLKAITHF